MGFEGTVLKDKNWSLVGDMCVEAPESYMSVSEIVGGILSCANVVLANVVVEANSSPPVAVLADSLSLPSFFFLRMAVHSNMSIFATIPALSLSMVRFGSIPFIVMGLPTFLSILPSCCQCVLTGLELC